MPECGAPVSAMTASTKSHSSGSLSVCADRLKPSVIAPERIAGPCSESAVLMIQRSSREAMPKRSATGMNSPGGISRPLRPIKPRQHLDMTALLPGFAKQMDLLAEQFQPAVLHGVDRVGGDPRRVEPAGARRRLRRKHRETVAAGGLGRVAGVVGAGQRIGHGGVGVVDEGDADAGREPARRRRRAEVGVAYRRKNGGGQPLGAQPIAIRHQQRELVAAEARGMRGWRQAADDAGGDALQRQVAGGMAGKIVERLEVVEIDIEHRQRQQPRGGDMVGQQPVEGGAVQEPGQRIVVRGIGEFLRRASCPR